jgi:hypothetical protein
MVGRWWRARNGFLEIARPGSTDVVDSIFITVAGIRDVHLVDRPMGHVLLQTINIVILERNGMESPFV